MRPILKDPNPLLQGNNREFSPIPPFSAKNCLENNCESSSLPDNSPEIPCATEQGINSTTTGNEFATIRELIRRNRESGAKVPTHPVHVEWKPRRGRADTVRHRRGAGAYYAMHDAAFTATHAYFTEYGSPDGRAEGVHFVARSMSDPIEAQHGDAVLLVNMHVSP